MIENISSSSHNYLFLENKDHKLKIWKNKSKTKNGRKTKKENKNISIQAKMKEVSQEKL